MRKSKEKVFEKEKITEILHQKQLEAKDFYNWTPRSHFHFSNKNNDL